MMVRMSPAAPRTLLAGAGGGIVAGAVAALVEVVGVCLQEGGTRPGIGSWPADYLRRRITRHLVLSALYGLMFAAFVAAVRRQDV